MAWRPVFSPDGEFLATRVERKGKYTLALNDKTWNRECDTIWDPVFSPDGRQLLARFVADGRYHRCIIPVTEITG